MPRQIRLFQGIDCAIRAATPNLYDELHRGNISGGWMARPFGASAAGSLPQRIGDWFEAELQQRVVLKEPGWPGMFERALEMVRAVELTGEDVQSLFCVGERIERTGAHVAEIASVCTIIALEYQSNKVTRDWVLKIRAELRRDRQAILRLQKRLPQYISDAEDDGDAREDRYRKLLDALNEWPGFPPSPGRLDVDWHRSAAEIADAYEGAVACGWSKEGPAVSFVVKAIKRVLKKEVSPAAVEKAISRTRSIKRPREAAEAAADIARHRAWEERKLQEDPDFFRRIDQDIEETRRYFFPPEP
jgi:hypothetical protein